VVVALRALERHAEEEARRLRGELVRAIDAVEGEVDRRLERRRVGGERRGRHLAVARAAVGVAAGGGDERGDHAVPALARGEGAGQPAVERARVDGAAVAVGADEEALPALREALGGERRGEERVDGAGALVAARGALVEERRHRLGRREVAREIEPGAAQEGRVVAGLGGGDARATPGGAQLGVEAVDLERRRAERRGGARAGAGVDRQRDAERDREEAHRRADLAGGVPTDPGGRSAPLAGGPRQTAAAVICVSATLPHPRRAAPPFLL